MNTTKRKEGDTSLGRSKRKAGTRALLLTAALLALLLVLNLVISLLPRHMTHFDTTEDGRYTLSETTRQFLSGLQTDVTVYVVCKDGYLERMPALMPPAEAERIGKDWTEEMFAHYDEISLAMLPWLLDLYAAYDRVSVEVVDPVKDAALFEDKFNPASLSDNSIVVMSEERFAVTDFASLTYYTLSGYGPMPSEYYMEMMQLYYQYYYYGYEIDLDTYIVPPSFGLEYVLTQLIDFVTADAVPATYVLQDSRPLGQNLASVAGQLMNGISGVSTLAIAESSPAVKYWNAERDGDIPATAAPLLIYAPEKDLSDATTDKILTFIENGGSVLLVTAPENADMPNLMRVAAAFGLSATSDVLLEGNANSFVESANNIKPTPNASNSMFAEIVSRGLSELPAPVFPNAHPIVSAETGVEGVTSTVAFAASNAAYVEGADGTVQDAPAATVGISATNSQSGASLVWFSSAEAFGDGVLALDENGLSLTYLIYAVRSQSEDFASPMRVIPTPDMTETATEINRVSLYMVAGVMIVVIPVLLIAAGVFVCVGRRYKKESDPE